VSDIPEHKKALKLLFKIPRWHCQNSTLTQTIFHLRMGSWTVRLPKLQT